MNASDLMPKGAEAERVLRARATQLAEEKTEIIEKEEGVSFVRFSLGTEEFYGIPYNYVKEVIRHIKPAPLPRAPGYISGVVNWRGMLIPVIDLKQFLHGENRQCDSYEYGIIIKAVDVTLAILTETIEGSDSYLPLKLAPPLTSIKAAKPEHISGIHQGVTAIINVEAVVSGIVAKTHQFGVVNE